MKINPPPSQFSSIFSHHGNPLANVLSHWSFFLFFACSNHTGHIFFLTGLTVNHFICVSIQFSFFTPSRTLSVSFSLPHSLCSIPLTQAPSLFHILTLTLSLCLSLCLMFESHLVLENSHLGSAGSSSSETLASIGPSLDDRRAILTNGVLEFMEEFDSSDTCLSKEIKRHRYSLWTKEWGDSYIEREREREIRFKKGRQLQGDKSVLDRERVRERERESEL